MKKVLSMMVAVAVLSQGIARADPATTGVTLVRDRAALAAHIDALEEGDHVAVVTDDDVVSGEVVDRDADDLVIDQTLIQGGAERVVVPRREIQGVRYQQATAHQAHVPVKALVTVFIVVGAVFVFLRYLGPMP